MATQSNHLFKLANYGFDVLSYSKAAERVNRYTNRTDLSNAFYEQCIKDIFGIVIRTKYKKEAELLFRYMVSEAVRFNEKRQYASTETIYNVAERKSRQFFAKYPEAIDGIDRNRAHIQKPLKHHDVGTKRDAAKELIVEMLKNKPAIKSADAISTIMKQLGMSKAGARTYFYSLKKTIFCGGDSNG